jgi:hypothetical protein
MSNFVSWKFGDENGKGHDSDVFLRVKPECKLKVRLVGQPVKVIKLWTNDRKCITVDTEAIGKTLKEEHPNLVKDVSIRYACWCIDRNSKSLKILDMPVSVAKACGNREALVGKKISGKEQGCDWSIVTNGKQGKDVRYQAVYIEETPLTQDEINMIEARKAEEKDKYDLTVRLPSSSRNDALGRLISGD